MATKSANQEFEEFALGEGVDPHGLDYTDFETFTLNNIAPDDYAVFLDGYYSLMQLECMVKFLKTKLKEKESED
ncbi:hypothetical protein [Vibrio parahaemolyticus]|uniref:hypothetical protein n=1 Tax=Vibrio parahaemolyticus TaxID=670 RepID=UPI0022B31826|nr:hypothetical protein [Vibrio parahaemolyticus]MCZ6297527.1 hypothetical protein [Vibrio parahaemolyticus]